METIIQKAYHVYHKGMISWGDPERFQEPTDVPPVYGETPSKAKSAFLRDEFWQYDYFDEDEITYLDLKCVRCKGADKIIFEGQVVTKNRKQEILAERERVAGLEALLKGDANWYYIKKRGVYYCPNSCGYTSQRHLAGIYTVQHAVSNAISCRELDIIPIDNSEHNEMLEKMIQDLQTRIIKK